MISEIRFYRTGWVIRVAALLLRWNSQDNYKALSIEWLTKDFLTAGGMTYKEYKLARKQAKEAAQLKRKEQEA